MKPEKVKYMADETNVPEVPAAPDLTDPVDYPTVDSSEGDSSETSSASDSKLGSQLPLIGGLGVGALGLLAAIIFGYLYFFGGMSNRLESARTAACDTGTAMATYDFNKLDDYGQTLESRIDGELKTTWMKSVDAAKAAITSGKAIATIAPNGLECGVIDTDDGTVRVVVNITQLISNVATQGQQAANQIPFVMTVERVGGFAGIGGDWKVIDAKSPLLGNG